MSHPNTSSLFSHDNLDVYRVAVDALVRGESIARPEEVTQNGMKRDETLTMA